MEAIKMENEIDDQTEIGLSLTEAEYSYFASCLLKGGCDDQMTGEYRGLLMLMYAHAVGDDNYNQMSHYEQLKLALMLHRMTDFLEHVRLWHLERKKRFWKEKIPSWVTATVKMLARLSTSFYAVRAIDPTDAEAKFLLKGFFNFFPAIAYRQAVKEMYHTTIRREVFSMVPDKEHFETTYRNLLDFFERIELWDLAETVVEKDQNEE